MPSQADREAALDRLLELTVLLGADMEQGLQRIGLSTARAPLLWEVGRRGPLTQRQLADALAVSPRNVTGLVDALEDAGFVQRRPHPTDRRSVLVALTSHGEQVIAELDVGRQELARQLFARMPSGEFAALSHGLDRLLERVHALVAADRGERPDA